MPAIITLKKNSTGEVVSFTDEYCDGPDDAWMWTDGNYCCDCNRFLFFERAKGRDPDLYDEECECGDTEYTLMKIERIDDVSA